MKCAIVMEIYGQALEGIHALQLFTKLDFRVNWFEILSFLCLGKLQSKTTETSARVSATNLFRNFIRAWLLNSMVLT